MSEKLRSQMATAQLLVLIGVVVGSFSAILVKAIVDMSPTAIALWRCALATLVLAAATALHPDPNARVIRDGAIRPFGLTVLAGTIFGINLHLWHHSILLVGAGLAALLTNTQACCCSSDCHRP